MLARISFKLFAAFIGLTTLILVLTLALAQWSFRWGFVEFMHGQERQRLAPAIQAMVEHYQSNEGWQGVDLGQVQIGPGRDQRRDSSRGSRNRPPPREDRPRSDGPYRRGGPGGPGGPRSRGPSSPHIPTALFDASGNWLSGSEDFDEEDYFSFPLYVDGDLVGELRSAPKPLIESQIATDFSQQQTQTSILIGSLCLFISIIVAWLLTYKLLKPIKAVQASIGKLADGQFGHQVNHTNKDELGMLTDDVNALSKILQDNRATKNRWFANISHELRTPLTVLNGEIEAIHAGIRPLSSDTLASIESEVTLLKHLVEDLYDLSMSEAGALRYKFEEADIGSFIHEVLGSAKSTILEAGLSIETDIESVQWKFDPNRIKQVILNLIANSIKYTEAPGVIKVGLHKNSSGIKITVNDSPPGCSEEHCEKLFEPLFRVDEARTREKDGRSAGLGLAIVKNIVEAHKGKIDARASNIGGLEIVIELY